IAGAVGAKKEDAPIAITWVIVWAIIMIFFLPLVSRALGLHTGVAGAWIGTSEFADAAGFAAAQAYGNLAGTVPGIAGSPEAAVQGFTLMKVIGRDIWIGIWAFVMAIIATTQWERKAGSKPNPAEIWWRFPKFVLGFFVASMFITAVAAGYSQADYGKIVKPEFVIPVLNLRTWAFIFCFFSIGLTTRFRELASSGKKPFLAFTAGVVVNVILGFILSTQVFAEHWSSLGTH
ncbi:MAG: putative sulfate exporter family transporter, partial [Bacteroidota bacterium]